MLNAGLLASLSTITEEERRLLEGAPLDKARYTDSSAFVVDSDRLLQAGKLISVRPHTRFVDFPSHRHNYVELIYMAAGSTQHLIDDKYPLTLHTGELLFLNQHVHHAIAKAGQGDIAVNFIVLPAFFDTAFDMIGPDNTLGRFLAGSLRRASSDISYLHFAVAQVLPVQNLMENMIWGIRNDPPNNRRINQVSMGLLFLQLLNHTDELSMSAAQRGNNSLVVEALREIEENYPRANFSRIAARYKVSLAYLSRLVKEATGRNFKELLRTKRLEKAAQMLGQTQLSVAEVIAAVGYENTSYFHRIFKEHYGVSPARYRRL